MLYSLTSDKELCVRRGTQVEQTKEWEREREREDAARSDEWRKKQESSSSRSVCTFWYSGEGVHCIGHISSNSNVSRRCSAHVRLTLLIATLCCQFNLILLITLRTISSALAKTKGMHFCCIILFLFVV